MTSPTFKESVSIERAFHASQMDGMIEYTSYECENSYMNPGSLADYEFDCNVEITISNMEEEENDKHIQEKIDTIKQSKALMKQALSDGMNIDEQDTNSENTKTTEANSESSKDDKNEENKTSGEKNPDVSKKLSVQDFQCVGFLGEGSYAKVVRVVRHSDQTQYAMKMMEKMLIKKENKVEHVYAEKEVLSIMNHPNIVKFFWCFQDKARLYFVIEFVPNGELFDFLRRMKKCTLELAKFYTAEIVNMLDYLHGVGIAHRDLKPENILMDEKWHLKLTDFGTAKFFKRTNGADNEKQPETRSTFVGTAEYVSPEVLKDQGSGAPADLWALGCILYQLIAGTPPFKSKTEYLTFESILNRKLNFPADFDEDAKDLVDKLIVMNPADRLGAGPEGFGNDMNTLKSHPFFKNINFSDLKNQDPPIDWTNFKSSPKKQNTSEETRSQSQSSSFEGSMPPDVKIAEFMEDKGIYKRYSDSMKDFQKKDEKIEIIKEGLVYKKKPFLFYDKRQLKLTNQPRLMYFDPKTNIYKGDVVMYSGVSAIKTSPKTFEVRTPHRIYFFKEVDKDSVDSWVELINKAIQDFVKKKNST